MNLLVLLLTVLVGGFQIGEDPSAHEVGAERKCITAERIIKPITFWKVLKTELKFENKTPYLEVNVHNPLNKKTPESVDAKFILSVDPVQPSNPERYNLLIATYYNDKATVTFRRIYVIQNVTVNKKQKQFPVQTACFARQIAPIMKFDPIMVEGQTPPDGGTK